MKNKLLCCLGFVSLWLFNACGTGQKTTENHEDAIEPTVQQELEEDTIEPTVQESETQENEWKEAVWDPKTPVDVYEFRAAWVATVANINWPSKPGLSTGEQKKEALKLLDFLEAHNFNAVIFQVRPQADALYKSELEPWSYFLTGSQGEAPDPFYDPLQFWIDAAHERGLELHAWLNPYRAHHTSAEEIGSGSVIKTDPELVVELENGMYWMDPALKGTQDKSAAVVRDLVSRYNLDGIHFDDYFYPYDSYNGGKDFPDDRSWKAYQEAGGTLDRGDWRRENVNVFIQRVYREIKEINPSVKFGLSPFGIWRPGYPQSVKGYDQYDKLYADARLWLNKGWIDYFTPQLYWQVNTPGQSFPVLLGWWQSENTKNRHLWPGMNVGLKGDEKNIDEVVNQIMITRGMLMQSPGAVHWSIGPLLKHKKLAKALIDGPYKKKTLVPVSPWLNNTPPGTPRVELQKKHGELQLKWEAVDEAFRYVVYFRYKDGNWDYKILPGNRFQQKLQLQMGDQKKKLEEVGVTAVGTSGNQSEFKMLKIY